MTGNAAITDQPKLTGRELAEAVTLVAMQKAALLEQDAAVDAEKLVRYLALCFTDQDTARNQGLFLRCIQEIYELAQSEDSISKQRITRRMKQALKSLHASAQTLDATRQQLASLAKTKFKLHQLIWAGKREENISAALTAMTVHPLSRAEQSLFFSPLKLAEEDPVYKIKPGKPYSAEEVRDLERRSPQDVWVTETKPVSESASSSGLTV